MNILNLDNSIEVATRSFFELKRSTFSSFIIYVFNYCLRRRQDLNLHDITSASTMLTIYGCWRSYLHLLRFQRLYSIISPPPLASTKIIYVFYNIHILIYEMYAYYLKIKLPIPPLLHFKALFNYNGKKCKILKDKSLKLIKDYFLP